MDSDDDVVFALDAYYTTMIEHVFSIFSRKFEQIKGEFTDAPLDIVVAGGTAMPKGFCTKIAEVVKGMKLPFAIKDIRMASDPRNAVVIGCLRQAIATQIKLEKTVENS